VNVLTSFARPQQAAPSLPSAPAAPAPYASYAREPYPARPYYDRYDRDDGYGRYDDRYGDRPRRSGDYGRYDDRSRGSYHEDRRQAPPAPPESQSDVKPPTEGPDTASAAPRKT
jgi:hypothetical protein